MEDRPQDRTEERRRRGPLGDEGDAEETRRVPQAGGEETARGGSPEDTAGGGTFAGGGTRGEEETSAAEAGTRVIRTPGASGRGEEEPAYPSGYLEAAEQREARLRDIYGGVDWLASFIGCVFALVAGGLLLLLLAGLVLAPLDFSLNLQDRALTASVITGLVVVGVALLLAYFVGGYVAGRLVRFDGGRNGMVTVLWGLLLAAILAVFPAFLPGALFRLLREAVDGSVAPAVGGLIATGATGIGILVGGLLLMVLGGFLGGRFGNRYHTQIDRTT